MADHGGRESVVVRAADTDDRAAVQGVLDAALLEPGDVSDLLAAGRGLVAEREEGGTAVGTLLAPATVPAADRPSPDGGTGTAGPEPSVDAHVLAVAVRPGARGRGVGSALVRAAGEDWGRLGAAYEPVLRPFYEGLGFESVGTLEDGREYGVRPAQPGG
ncbi:MAG: GNAT family N-acetyltransferase [Halobacteriaceae archaeon]